MNAPEQEDQFEKLAEGQIDAMGVFLESDDIDGGFARTYLIVELQRDLAAAQERIKELEDLQERILSDLTARIKELEKPEAPHED